MQTANLSASRPEIFTTLCDSSYVPQAVALFRSLKAHIGRPFSLHWLCLDAATYQIAQTLSSDPVLVPTILDDFVRIRPGLLAARRDRTWTEFCWTLASQWTEAVHLATGMRTTYLDADLYFFSDPEPIFSVAGSSDVILFEHRFPSWRANHRPDVYNVGWVTFGPSPAARDCLSWWAARVLERCQLHMPDGTAGDQGWLTRFHEFCKVHVCPLAGAGLAPYNVDAQTVLPGPRLANGEPVIFYHFHETRFGDLGQVVKRTNYPLKQDTISELYLPYEAEILAVCAELKRAGLC